jgi:hypothetical protein
MLLLQLILSNLEGLDIKQQSIYLILDPTLSIILLIDNVDVDVAVYVQVV